MRDAPRRSGQRVLAIQHVAAEPPGVIGRALEAEGVAVEIIHVDRGDPVPRRLGDAAGLVVMGGPMGVYEADSYPFLGEELEIIRQAVDLDRPVLGICLGSQLLATALGARVSPSGRKELGWHPVRLTPAGIADPLFAGLPGTFTPLHWHGDVFELPEGAVHLASSEMTAHQAFRRGRAAYGLLFHLEVSTNQVAAMAKEFADELSMTGVSPAVLDAGASRHGAEIWSIGDTVFRRWAQLVRGCA